MIVGIIICGFVTTNNTFHIKHSPLIHCQYENMDWISLKQTQYEQIVV